MTATCIVTALCWFGASNLAPPEVPLQPWVPGVEAYNESLVRSSAVRAWIEVQELNEAEAAAIEKILTRHDEAFDTLVRDVERITTEASKPLETLRPEERAHGRRMLAQTELSAKLCDQANRQAQLDDGAMQEIADVLKVHDPLLAASFLLAHRQAALRNQSRFLIETRTFPSVVETMIDEAAAGDAAIMPEDAVPLREALGMFYEEAWRLFQAQRDAERDLAKATSETVMLDGDTLVMSDDRTVYDQTIRRSSSRFIVRSDALSGVVHDATAKLAETLTPTAATTLRARLRLANLREAGDEGHRSHDERIECLIQLLSESDTALVNANDSVTAVIAQKETELVDAVDDIQFARLRHPDDPASAKEQAEKRVKSVTSALEQARAAQIALLRGAAGEAVVACE